MVDRVIKLFLSVIFILSNSAFAANQFPDWFAPFPLSTLENQSSRTVPDYQLPLSQITRIQGLLRTQDERRLSGELNRKTWELASGSTPEQGFNHVRHLLIENQADILFECRSRHCGASNLWANQVFGYANLLGVDSTQLYMAAEIDTGHMAVYAVRRGNGRVYLHVDYIKDTSRKVAQDDAPSQADEALSWQEHLIRQGFVDLVGWSVADESTVNEIRDLLNEHDDMQLRVVVHQRVDTGDTGLTETNATAQRFEADLIEAGISMERIDAFGIGALAPSVLASEMHAITLIRLGD